MHLTMLEFPRRAALTGPFGIRSGFVRGPFEVRSGPFGIRSGSVLGPFGVRSGLRGISFLGAVIFSIDDSHHVSCDFHRDSNEGH